MAGTPVYLRDLSDMEQQTWIDEFKKKKQSKLLKALEDGNDITVGYYLDEAKVEE